MALLFFTQIARAQDPYGIPLSDVKEVLESNETLYDSLYTSLLNGDSLSPNDYFMLYYGAAYQSNYSPYSQGMALEPVNEAIDDEDYEKGAKEGEEILASGGLNIKAILYTAYCFRKSEDSLAADKYYDMYYNLLSVPFNSGDGESEKTAFVVASVVDEYLILDELEADFSGQSLISKNGSSYDVMSCTLDGKKVDLYFNINQPFGIGLANMLGDKSSKKKNKSKKKKKK